MKVTETDLPGVLLIEPRVFKDERGFFFESFNQRAWKEATGLDTVFVQDNHSRSVQGVLRGIHYQIRQAQAKLVRVARGEVFDVAVDLRRGSPHFGRWYGVRLSGDNHRQLYIPEGFGHGFLVLSDTADFLYRTSDFYAPEHERTIVWNDPDLGIRWPLEREPIVSDKDRQAPPLSRAEVYP